MTLETEHSTYLEHALNYAIQYDYLPYPNPSVGCILVKHGIIIGKGASQKAGSSHAEIMAIQNALNNGFNIQDSTAYVTLEPCAHFGKTAPCINALIKHKISHVHIGILDPNPLVNGLGIKILQQNNIKVTLNQEYNLEQKIIYSMRGFLHTIKYKKPWIRLKLATSLDGIMALNNGKSKWLTGTKAREHNQFLRARAGAVVSSINTVISDNPLLNVRKLDIRQPLRVILDTNALGVNYLHYEIFKQQDIYPLLWVCSINADKEKIVTLKKYTQVLQLPIDKNHINLSKLVDYLYLKLNINEIHVEAGAYLLTNFIQQNLWNEIALYQAPIFLGIGKHILKQQNLTNLDSIKKFKLFSSQKIENDNLLILLNN